MAEDLTTYTQVGFMTVTASRVTATFYADQNRYLYKDFGTDHFDKIDLKFAGIASDTDPYGYDGRMYMGFTNVVGDASGWGAGASIKIRFMRSGPYGEGNYYLEMHNGSEYYDYDFCLISPGTVYYFTLTRAAGNGSATLKVYTDSTRTTLFDTLTISGLGTTKWRYFYAASGYNVNDGTVYVSGYYENFVFGGSIPGQVRVIGMMM